MSKKRKKTIFRIISIIALFIVIFSYLYVSSEKLIQEYALKKYESLSSVVGYYAFDESLSESYDFSSIVKTERNKDGEIIMVSSNSYLVNKIATEISKRAFERLNKEIDGGVEIPIGAFTGIRLVAGFGKKINMKLLSVSSVKSEIVNSFEQAGINQTRQMLYLKLKSNASITTRTGNKTITNELTMLIYDNLIVGKVPSVLISPMIIGKG